MLLYKLKSFKIKKINKFTTAFMENKTKFETFDQLVFLTELYQNEDSFNKTASLLINALNDWPNAHSLKISEFIQEFESYFGKPITIDKIRKNSIGSTYLDAWRCEAGSSLIEMIEYAEVLYNRSDFSYIIEQIIIYYQNKIKMIDFVAELTYRTLEEGGRSTPAFSKYRPQVKFDFDDMQTSGEQTFINKTVVYPGEEVKATLRIIGQEYFSGRLEDGMFFEFREGSRIIGTGKIVKIMNEKLRKTINS
ncbi:hypothetical protein EDF66_101199 [Sphingobacterium sp. JUb20]|nr:hypothetical protein EDF66_101199 [Sphingobacterium sp. JUb20]